MAIKNMNIFESSAVSLIKYSHVFMMHFSYCQSIKENTVILQIAEFKQLGH